MDTSPMHCNDGIINRVTQILGANNLIVFADVLSYFVSKYVKNENPQKATRLFMAMNLLLRWIYSLELRECNDLLQNEIALKSFRIPANINKRVSMHFINNIYLLVSGK